MKQGFITVKKASEILDVSPHYIRKLIKSGRISGQQLKNSNRWQIDRASIESYRKTPVFEKDIIELAKPQQMTIKEAVENVEISFDSDVITYIMHPNAGTMIEPIDALHLDNLLTKLKPYKKGTSGKKFKKVTLILNSGGGILEAAIKIVGVIKTYANEFEVIVPFMAKSAATIISLKADKLYLTTVSELGPIDPVVQSPTNPSIRVPAQAIQGFIDRYGSRLNATDKTPLDEIIIQKLNLTIDPYILGAHQAAKEFSKFELNKCLEKYNLTKEQLKTAEELFLDTKSHSYPILSTDLEQFGIGELIPNDDPKSKSIKTLMSVFENYMSSLSIIKVIAHRDEMTNTVPSPAQIKQKSVQTGT